MILTTIVASENNVEIIKHWLGMFLPAWSGFHITNVGKYLGIHMGPLAGSVQWEAPLEKFKARIHDIKRDAPPLAMVGPLFASRAASVLGYVGQLVLPPKYFTTAELWAAHKVLGMPLALDTEAIFSLHLFGSVKLLRMSNYLKAAMLRAASKTIRGYDEMHLQLGKRRCVKLLGEISAQMGGLNLPFALICSGPRVGLVWGGIGKLVSSRACLSPSATRYLGPTIVWFRVCVPYALTMALEPTERANKLPFTSSCSPSQRQTGG